MVRGRFKQFMLAFPHHGKLIHTHGRMRKVLFNRFRERGGKWVCLRCIRKGQ